jgi:hypothetical protein
MRVSAPTSFLGRLRELVATSPRFGVCEVKPSRFAAALRFLSPFYSAH